MKYVLQLWWGIPILNGGGSVPNSLPSLDMNSDYKSMYQVLQSTLTYPPYRELGRQYFMHDAIFKRIYCGPSIRIALSRILKAGTSTEFPQTPEIHNIV